MLYFCFPIAELQTKNPLLGRCADIKEIAIFELNESNYFIIIEMMQIFGMLSPSHKADSIAIIDTILRND
jgi:hypothetical protein